MAVSGPAGRAGPATLWAFVGGVARLGLLGFGGVGPQAYDTFVVRSEWLDAHEFADALGLAQALPGANVVNLCAIVGDRWFGPLGALAGVAAITVPPLLVVLLAASVLGAVTPSPRVAAAQCAIVVASAGLILATAWRVFSTLARRRVTAALIAGALAVTVAAHAAPMPVATLIAVALALLIDRFGGARP